MKLKIFKLMLMVMVLGTSQSWADPISDEPLTDTYPIPSVATDSGGRIHRNRERENPDRDSTERVLSQNRRLKRETLRRIEALREAMEEKEEQLREQRAEIRVLERRQENTAEAIEQKERIEQELRTLRSDLEALLDLHDNQEVTCDALETSLEREAEAIEDLSTDIENIRDEADQENEEERVVDEERDSMFTLAGRVLAVVRTYERSLNPEDAFMFGMQIATQAQDLFALSPMLGQLQMTDLMERITNLEQNRDRLIQRYENRRKTRTYRESLKSLDIKIQALSGAMLAYNQVMSQGGVVPTTGYDVTGGGAAQTNPMQLYMMMSLLNGQNNGENGSDGDLMQLMLLSQMNGGQAQMDPMMLMMMSGGDDEMLPLLLMAQNGQISLYDENGQPNQLLLQLLLDDGGSRRHRSRGESMGLEFMMGLGQDPYSSGL